jgi:hypothetical protein
MMAPARVASTSAIRRGRTTRPTSTSARCAAWTRAPRSASSGIGEHRSYPRGRIALAAYAGGVGRCTVYYANVVVTELE